MKLPFKLPSIKLPKFGKKKADDDEDDDDDFDFDPSDFEGDANADLGDAPESPAAEGDEVDQAASADDDEAAAPDDAPPSPADEGMEEMDPGAEEAAVSPADEAPPSMEGDGEEGEAGEEPDFGDDLEDIDFGDDDGDEDDEEGGASKLKMLLADPKRKMMVIGGGATAAVLLIGGLSWLLLSGDGGGEKAAEEEKSKIPKVAMDIAPKRKPMSGTSLNAIAAGETGPGAGVVVPVVSPMVFASLSPPAVTDGPLGEGNDPALSENSPQGPLPIVSTDGRMPWKAYAKPFDVQDARPRIAIVVSGLGLSEAATEAAIRLLPGGVTLAFDPYAPGLLDWAARARQAGHEVMIMMPLEPATFPVDDPGPQGLMTTNAPEENRLRLEYVLSRMTGYIGVMTVMGSKFNTSDDHLRTFLGELKTRGLMFLEGGTNSKSLAPKIATEIGLPRALTDLIIDSIPTKEAIDAQLVELEEILGRQPAAVAIAEAYPSSIERLAAWTAGLESKNLVLAPLSDLADKQFLQ